MPYMHVAASRRRAARRCSNDVRVRRESEPRRHASELLSNLSGQGDGANLGTGRAIGGRLLIRRPPIRRRLAMAPIAAAPPLTIMKVITTMTTHKQHILDEARATLRSSKGIHSDTLDRDALAAWSALKKARAEPDEPPPVPEPPPPPIDWAPYINQKIAVAIEREREWLLTEMLPELVATLRHETSVELSLDVRRLNCELAELRALIGEAQAMVRADRAARGIASPAIDVPKPATLPN
jgi:hypothetical protein